jgi:hypothetical protein
MAVDVPQPVDVVAPVFGPVAGLGEDGEDLEGGRVGSGLAGVAGSSSLTVLSVL